MPTPDQSNFQNEFERVSHYAMETAGDLKMFILRGHVVDLAVGVVIGAAFESVINGLVSNVITPLIPISNTSLATLQWPVPYNPHAKINLGGFINEAISFLIITIVLYFFVMRPVSALLARYKPKEVQIPTTRDCPYCLQSVPIGATRCAHCTSPLIPLVKKTNDTPSLPRSSPIRKEGIYWKLSSREKNQEEGTAHLAQRI
ncbi:MAG TPA: MscL family protein [Ktedonobacteraceae bacterium]|nr:MscL family protein [Ktedonobacteraceae bacterium]